MLQLVYDLPRIKVTHDGREVNFDGSDYRSPRMTKIITPFTEINRYWSGLEIAQHNLIFSIYTNIEMYLNSITDPYLLVNELIPLVNELWALHDFKTMRSWLILRNEIYIPTNLKIKYSDSDIEEQTYLRDEYIDLVTLALQLRIMVPIWGDFLSKIKTSVGAQFKELVGLMLISNTPIYNSEVMNRLRIYLNQPIEGNKANNQAALLAGLGSDDLPNWILAKILISKVAIADLSAANGMVTIITTIYSYLNQTLKDMSSKFGGGVRERDDRKVLEEDSEDNSSVLDRFKIKQNISIGTSTCYNIYADNPHRLYKALDDTAPFTFLESCLETMYNGFEINKCTIGVVQRWICQMVVDKVIPARALEDSIERPVMLKVMAVVQALLWYWEFNLLAGLTIATPILNYNLHIINETKIKTSNDSLKDLEGHYPYINQASTVRNQIKGSNPATIAITIIADKLLSKGWSIVGPSQLIDSLYPISDKYGRITIPSNIVNYLSKFIIKVIS